MIFIFRDVVQKLSDLGSNDHAPISGVQVYRQFYKEEKEKANGVLAICVSRPDAQPYISIASIVHVSLPPAGLFHRYDFE